jgi:hypothetical protein
LAQLVDQPRVLNSDHRLVGKSLRQFDLLVGERVYNDNLHRRARAFGFVLQPMEPTPGVVVS